MTIVSSPSIGPSIRGRPGSVGYPRAAIQAAGGVRVRVRRSRRRPARGAVRAPARPGHVHRRPPVRRPVAGHERGRAHGAARVRRPLGARARRAGTRRPSPPTSGSTATSSAASSTRSASPRPSSARRPGARCSGSTSSAEACIRCWRGSSRRWRTGWRRSSAGSRGSRPARAGVGGHERAREPAGGPAPRRGRRTAHRWRRRPRPERRGGRRGRRPHRPGASPCSSRTCGPPRTPPSRRSTRWASTSRTEVVPERHRRLRDRRAAVHGQAAPHAPRSRRDAGARPGPGRGRVRCRPRRDGPHRARHLARLAPRRAGAGRRGGAGPRHARRDRGRSPGRGATWSRSARTSSAGSRRSAGSVTSSGSWTSRCGSTGRRSSCAPSAGRCWTRPGRSMSARRRSSRSRRFGRSGRRTRSSRTCARRTPASCACSRSTRRCPGHYLQGAYANRGASLARRVFRSGLFAEGWAVYVTQVMLDRGLRRRRPGPVARPLEVLPARRGQHDHRRPHPHHGHDVRGGDRAHGRRCVPGAGRGPRQGRARPAVVHPARHLLPGVGGHVGDRGRRPAAGGGRGGRSAGAVPAPRVCGGYPATPGFDERAHLEAVIAHGAPPIPLLRRILLGE